MSLLRKWIPLVFVDSSLISVGSLLVGEACSVLLSRTSLDSKRFSLLDTLSTQVCMELSSGDDTGLSSLPSSERKKNR